MFFIDNILIVAASVAISALNPVNNDISLYEQRLEMFNDEYGTDYAIPENDEIIEFYTSMTPEEFDSYIMSIYDGSFYDTEKPSIYKSKVDPDLTRNEYMVSFDDTKRKLL